MTASLPDMARRTQADDRRQLAAIRRAALETVRSGAVIRQLIESWHARSRCRTCRSAIDATSIGTFSIALMYRKTA